MHYFIYLLFRDFYTLVLLILYESIEFITMLIWIKFGVSCLHLDSMWWILKGIAVYCGYLSLHRGEMLPKNSLTNPWQPGEMVIRVSFNSPTHLPFISHFRICCDLGMLLCWHSNRGNLICMFLQLPIIEGLILNCWNHMFYYNMQGNRLTNYIENCLIWLHVFYYIVALNEVNWSQTVCLWCNFILNLVGFYSTGSYSFF